ncbi:hypothetical protein ACFVRB_33530 [Streptomyces nojiriensis]|uniref:hypothetical protein n=1 Tax=Streptomyces nojiriensis TaxID=66374 RepID=UPI0036DE541C
MKQQTAQKASLIADRIREKAGRAAHVVRDRTPDPVLDKTVQATAQVWGGATRTAQYVAGKTPEPLLEGAGRAATVARGNRTPLLLVGAAIVGLVLVRRSRGRRADEGIQGRVRARQARPGGGERHGRGAPHPYTA